MPEIDPNKYAVVLDAYASHYGNAAMVAIVSIMVTGAAIVGGVLTWLT